MPMPDALRFLPEDIYRDWIDYVGDTRPLIAMWKKVVAAKGGDHSKRVALVVIWPEEIAEVREQETVVWFGKLPLHGTPVISAFVAQGSTDPEEPVFIDARTEMSKRLDREALAMARQDRSGEPWPLVYQRRQSELILKRAIAKAKAEDSIVSTSQYTFVANAHMLGVLVADEKGGHVHSMVLESNDGSEWTEMRE